MMSAVHLYFLLSVLAEPSYAISCYWCWSSNDVEDLCRENSTACPVDYYCSVIILEYYKDISKDRTYLYIYSGCVQPEQCGLMGSYSSGVETTWIATACCKTDNCIPDVPATIRTSSDPSGVTCPSCASQETFDCEPDGIMACRGDETNCALETTQYQAYYDEAYMEYYWYGSNASEYLNSTGTLPFWLQKLSNRGCATDTVCDLGPEIIKRLSLKEITTYTCKGGTEESSSYPTTLILCCIAHILLYLFMF
ncbi:uncharacterized protein [Aquarana catesbeiana]|uniref:uncharacterized protein isoform X2 n=1 Tax=Aquarana catesbeiana TaxID=8400 RepID=UPI003CC9BBBE